MLLVAHLPSNSMKILARARDTKHWRTVPSRPCTGPKGSVRPAYPFAIAAAARSPSNRTARSAGATCRSHGVQALCGIVLQAACSGPSSWTVTAWLFGTQMATTVRQDRAHRNYRSCRTTVARGACGRCGSCARGPRLPNDQTGATRQRHRSPNGKKTSGGFTRSERLRIEHFERLKCN